MTSICRWVQFSSLWWVSVVVGGQHSVCHTVLVPRIAQPIICWTCSVLSSGWLCVTMAVYWLLSWQGWNYKLLHGISTSPLFTWKCHSSHWHWLWQTCVSVSYSAQCAWKGLLQFLEAVKSIQFFEKKFSDHWRARLHTKWTFRSIGSIQSIWMELRPVWHFGAGLWGTLDYQRDTLHVRRCQKMRMLFQASNQNICNGAREDTVHLNG